MGVNDLLKDDIKDCGGCGAPGIPIVPLTTNKQYYIGVNDNWWLDGKDTGKPSQGPPGEGLFLVFDSMNSLRLMSNDDKKKINSGVYKGVRLVGYYKKGDAPEVIYFADKNNNMTDDKGSVIAIDGVEGRLVADSIDNMDVLNFGSYINASNAHVLNLTISRAADLNNIIVDFSNKKTVTVTAKITNGLIKGNNTTIIYDDFYFIENILIGRWVSSDGLRLSNSLGYRFEKELYSTIYQYSEEWYDYEIENVKRVGLTDIFLIIYLKLDSLTNEVTINYGAMPKYVSAEHVQEDLLNKGLNIVGIKFHQQTGFDKSIQSSIIATNWENCIKAEIDKFKDVPTLKYVTTINENQQWVASGSVYLTAIENVSLYIKNLGLNSVIAHASIFQMTGASSVVNNYSYNGINFYPTLSFLDEEAVVEDFVINQQSNRIAELQQYYKKNHPNTKVSITEFGTRNKIKSLRFPWNWVESETGLTSPTNNPIRIYYEFIFPALVDKSIDFNTIWFTDAYNNQERADIFINQIIKYGYGKYN